MIAKETNIDNKTKKLVIQKYEQGLSMNFIESAVVSKEIKKTKAKHIVEEIIYEHLMQMKLN